MYASYIPNKIGFSLQNWFHMSNLHLMGLIVGPLLSITHLTIIPVLPRPEQPRPSRQTIDHEAEETEPHRRLH